MPAPASPQLRFLLRGSGLFILLLALWWWVLLGPMLTGLRLSTSGILWLLHDGRTASGVTVAPDGWILRVPIPDFIARRDTVQKAYGRAPGAPPVKVRSFQLGVPQRTPSFFLLGFPLFWALVLAAPWSGAGWRAMAAGTGLLAVLAQASLLAYTVYSIATTLKVGTTGLAGIVWSGLEYLNVNVAPYMAPLLIALWLHAGLRAQIFSWGAETAPAAVPIPTESGKAKRGRYRGK
jgi:hypothetical protein